MHWSWVQPVTFLKKRLWAACQFYPAAVRFWSGRSKVQITADLIRCSVAASGTFLWKELCCPGTMAQRWALQTRYTHRHNTVSLNERFGLIWISSAVSVRHLSSGASFIIIWCFPLLCTPSFCAMLRFESGVIFILHKAISLHYAVLVKFFFLRQQCCNLSTVSKVLRYKQLNEY